MSETRVAVQVEAPRRGRGKITRRLAVTLAPWDRQPGESEAYHALFLRYRDMLEGSPDGDRSLRRLAAAVGRPVGTLYDVSRRYDWQRRVLAWDNWLRQKQDKEARKQREGVVERHRREVNALAATAMRLLQAPPRLPQRERNDWVPDARAVQAAQAALRTAIELERLSWDMPTQHTRQDVTLKQAVADALSGQKILVALMQEHLCDECRERVSGEYDRVLAHHRALEEGLAT